MVAGLASWGLSLDAVQRLPLTKATDMQLYAAIDLHSNNSFLVVLDEEDRTVFSKRLPYELAVRDCVQHDQEFARRVLYNAARRAPRRRRLIEAAHRRRGRRCAAGAELG